MDSENNKKIILLADIDGKDNIDLAADEYPHYKIYKEIDFDKAYSCILENRERLILLLTNSSELIKSSAQLLRMGRATALCITDNELDNKTKCYEAGADAIITRPFNSFTLKKVIDGLIRLYNDNERLEHLVEERTSQIRKSMNSLKHINVELVDTMSSMIEFRNMESGEHIKRIRNYTAIILRYIMKYYPEYGLTDEDAETIEITSAMHDIGKIAVPDNILLKNGPLNYEEREIMKTHTTKGAEIIDKIAFKGSTQFHKYCYDIARFHHERYDGNGYPDGLSGDEIPIAAQIVALADVYDALVSIRIYKESYPPEKAYDMILNDECGVFSDKIKDCFLRAKAEILEMTEKIGD